MHKAPTNALGMVNLCNLTTVNEVTNRVHKNSSCFSAALVNKFAFVFLNQVDTSWLLSLKLLWITSLMKK